MEKFAAVGIVLMLAWVAVKGGVAALLVTIALGGGYAIVRRSREARAARG